MSQFPNEIKETFSKLALSGKAVGDEPCVVGGFVRDWILGIPFEEIKDIDIISKKGKVEAVVNDFVSRYGIGEPKEYDHTGTKTVFFKNFKLEFQSSDNPNVHFPIEEELIKMNIENNFFNKNIYERDFTINTLCYDVSSNKILDMTGYGMDDLNKGILRTPIDPNAAIFFNPLIILRGLRFVVEFDMKFDEDFKSAIIKGLEFLPKAVQDRDKRFVNKIIRDTFKHNEEEADKLYRQYGIYDLIDMPKDIMDRKIKSDMGIKYFANYDIVYTVADDKSNVDLLLDFEDIYENFDNIKKVAANLYLSDIIDEETNFKLAYNDDVLFSLKNIKTAIEAFENNKIIAMGQSGNFLYERYRRRKEYRDRKRREDKRDRINKLKTWHDLQKRLRR